VSSRTEGRAGPLRPRGPAVPVFVTDRDRRCFATGKPVVLQDQYRALVRLRETSWFDADWSPFSSIRTTSTGAGTAAPLITSLFAIAPGPASLSSRPHDYRLSHFSPSGLPQSGPEFLRQHHSRASLSLYPVQRPLEALELREPAGPLRGIPVGGLPGPRLLRGCGGSGIRAVSRVRRSCRASLRSFHKARDRDVPFGRRSPERRTTPPGEGPTFVFALPAA
jgi:hypothetical protein